MPASFVAAGETSVGIGHEADRPILDDVADYRASTPTDAAKNVVPDVAEESYRIDEVVSRIVQRIGHYVSTQTDFLGQVLSRPMMTNPYVFLTEKQQDLERALDELRGEVSLTIDREASEHASREGMLRSLSPQSTLDRGYSVVRDQAGQLIKDGSKVKSGTKLNIRLAKGEIEATSN